MEQNTDTPAPTLPSRGTPESAAWMRATLDGLGLGPSALARWLIAQGDDRPMATVLRSIQRMLSGEARVSGEMRAVLGFMAANRRRDDEAVEGLELLVGQLRQPETHADADLSLIVRTASKLAHQQLAEAQNRRALGAVR